MEFHCVFSISGSLASYHVQKEGDGLYKAVLRSGAGRRDDVPAEIALSKESGNWKAEPWNEEVVKSLINAIETNT
jgi:hypothetical protein